MSEEEKLHNELEENYEKIVEMLSNGNFLQLNGKAINLTELNEYINAQQEEIERLHSIIKEVREKLTFSKSYLNLYQKYVNISREKYDNVINLLDKENKQ